ncbi:MAG: hypothetical protein N2746_05240 [Deltaproteobacteria bacterium]|nr:hypothetical protein [Deltaproteobacteria bacterium]
MIKNCVLIILLFFAGSALAENVPLNLGFGPALNYIPKIISNDQFLHYSLKLDIYAVLDRDFIEKHKSKIPKKYRKFVESKDELRVSYIFIPESLFISPKYQNTGIYGINFRPLSLGLPIVKTDTFKNRLNMGINLTYLFIHSDKIFNEKGSMHFLRPALNLQFDNLLKISKKFLVSLGVDTYFFIPQKVEDKSNIFESGDINDSIWFIGQIYVLLNPRVMYKVKM